MHDGRFGTLEEVVGYYNRGGAGLLGTDPRIHPLGLSAAEQLDLVDFLRALSSNRAAPPAPALPPP
jgi:cytochrome c peroxidase